jgi:hypothetical protein
VISICLTLLGGLLLVLSLKRKKIHEWMAGRIELAR